METFESDSPMSAAEMARLADLMDLAPTSGRRALDVGARGGNLSVRLAERFRHVTALDLVLPTVSHPRVECVQADAKRLPFSDGAFDFVLCAEVLEHIPTDSLGLVCSELQRVCAKTLLIGVPYRQDIRVGRTTCYSCMKPNPPWGHINIFDESRLVSLFRDFRTERQTFVGETMERTNGLSRVLLDLAGNPYGTYSQEESCIHCGEKLLPPPKRTMVRKVATRMGYWARSASTAGGRPRPCWIHLLFERSEPLAAKAVATGLRGAPQGVRAPGAA